MPKNMNRDETFASANSGLRKKRIGSIGFAARSSQRTNAATSRRAERQATRAGSPGSSSPRRSRGSGPRRFRTGRRSRGRGRAGRACRPGRSVSVSRESASGINTSPIGTLSQKIHCHERPSTTAPPTTGPKATARPLIPPQAPSASPRFPAGTAALRIVSVSGITSAPPSPCRARARLSASTEGASAAATEPTVKMPSPIEKTRRRPKRSPSAAPVRSSTANVSV